MSSDQHGIKPEINNKKIARTIPKQLEMKKHTGKQHISQRRNLKRNLKCSELSVIENTEHANIEDVAKAELRRKLMALSTYIRREGLKFNNLSFYLRKMKQKRKLNAMQTEENKETIAEINGIENILTHL